MADMNLGDGDNSADMSITDTKVTIDVQSVDEGDVQCSRVERSITRRTTTESTRTDEQEEDCGPHTSVSSEQLTTEGAQGRTVGVGSGELQEDDQHNSERSCLSHDPAILTTEDCEIADSETEGIEGYSEGDDVFEAAQSGNMAVIVNYLDQGFPPVLADEEGWSILHHAASHGQVEVIKLLHSRGCSVDLVDRHGRTPLHHAAASGECGSIGVLVELGSNVNHVDNEGNTPLKWSVMWKMYSVMAELLKYGGVGDVQCSLGSESSDDLRRQEFVAALDEETLLDLLFESAFTGDVQTVSAIIDGGCPVNALDGDGGTALHRAASGGHVDVVRVLVERGASVDAQSSDGRTPLHLAASNGVLGVVSELLKLGGKASMAVVSYSHGTPLHQAAIQGHKEIVSVLLDAGCPIDVVDNEGQTSLHYVAASGGVESIGLLVQHGLDVNKGDRDGWTPLHSACLYGKLESVCEILRLGGKASITKVADKYETPLHQAAYCGHVEIVSVLLDAGCPIDLQDLYGKNALHYAARGGSVEVIDFLVERGLDVNGRAIDGRTPLHWASAYGKLEAVCELLRLGAQVSMTVVAGTGGTPLHQAAMMGHEDIVSVLLDAGCPIDVVDIIGRNGCYLSATGSDAANLLKRCNVNAIDNCSTTPLHAASLGGRLEVVHKLLELGGNPNIVSGIYGTPLHQATLGNHVEVASVLSEAMRCEVQESSVGEFLPHVPKTCTKNPLDYCTSVGFTPAMWAAMTGKLEILKLLVSKHCDISLRSGFNLSLFEHAVMSGKMSNLANISEVCGFIALNTRELLLTLQDKELLDPKKLLILGSIAGDPLVIDTLSSEESKCTEAAHQRWTTTRKVLRYYYQEVDKAIYDQLGLSSECPLSPLHIALLLLKYRTEYLHIVKVKFALTVNDS